MNVRAIPTFFPLHSVTFPSSGGKGVCGCKDGEACKVGLGKHPAVRYSLVEPGASVQSPCNRYGILTGVKFGLVIIDIDAKEEKDGRAAWNALAASLNLPATFMVATPSGGWHVYFAISEPIANSQSRIANGIDVRGEGGFAVAPGTVGPSGVLYTPLNDRPIAPAPENLLQVLRAARAVQAAGSQGQAVDVEWPEATLHALAEQYRNDARNWEAAVSGRGGHDRTWLLALRGVRHYALPAPVVLSILLSEFNPRCQPPWSEEELRHKVEGAETADAPIATAMPPGAFDALAAVAKPAAPPPIVVDLPEVRGPRRKRDATPHTYAFTVGALSLPPKARATSTLEIVQILLRHPMWAGVFQFDYFQHGIIAVKPPCPLQCEDPGCDLTEDDVTSVECWLMAVGLKAPAKMVKQAIRRASRDNATDSYAEWANDLPVLDVAHARGVLRELTFRGFAAALSPGAEVFVVRHLVGGIARAFTPGAQHDHVVILAGQKGLRKTSAVAALYDASRFRQQMPSIRDRDGSHALRGFAGVNFDEMKAIFLESFQTVRDFVTRRVDEIREFGNGDRVRIFRRNLFWGTTNPDEGLIRDPMTDRRWLFLHVGGRCDVEWIAANRELIWSAAKTLFLAGESSYLSDEEKARYLGESQATYLESDDWEDLLSGWLNVQSPEHRAGGFSLLDMFVGMFGGIDPINARRAFDARTSRRLAACARRLHFEPLSVRDAATKRVSRRWVYTRTDGAS